MIRARFKTDPNDPRPVNWPIKHPYWVTGCSGANATIVAYADDEAEIMRNWPDAEEIDVMDDVDTYTYTSRFPKPDWFQG